MQSILYIKKPNPEPNNADEMWTSPQNQTQTAKHMNLLYLGHVRWVFTPSSCLYESW